MPVADPGQPDLPPGRRTPLPRWRVALPIVGLVLAIGAPLWWFTTHGPPHVTPINPGALERLSQTKASPPITRSAPDAAAGPALGSSSRPLPATASAHTGRLPDIPISKVGGELVRTSPLARPVHLRIPAISVNADVVAEGVATNGQVAIPDDIQRVGWFRYGVAPGASAGSVVIVGHLDSATQPGLGALAYLRTLPAGASIDVTTADGRSWRYRVVAREAFAKDHLPRKDIFARTGQPRLILMTCGGAFDQARRSYDDTVVVTAVPVSDSRATVGPGTAGNG